MGFDANMQNILILLCNSVKNWFTYEKSTFIGLQLACGILNSKEKCLKPTENNISEGFNLYV